MSVDAKKRLPNILLRICAVIVSIIIILAATAGFIFRNELRSLATIHVLNDHPLLRMTYYGDYGFDDFLKTGASSDRDIEQFVTRRLLRGLPVDLGITEAGGGCTVFMVKSETGDILFCRNYDFPYTPAMQVFTAPDSGYRSVSTVELDFLGYTKDFMPSGVNFDSINALAAPFLPWDGMNEKGFAIALLAVPEARGPDDADKVTLNTTTAIRLVLDKAATVDEAVELMRQYNIYFSAGIKCHYLIADRAGNSVLVEYWDGALQTVAPAEDYHVASNFIAYGGLNIGEGYSEFERYETVKAAIEENGGFLTEQQAIGLLAKVGVYAGGESKLQWSVVYNLTTGDGKIFMHRDVNTTSSFRMPPSVK